MATFSSREYGELCSIDQVNSSSSSDCLLNHSLLVTTATGISRWTSAGLENVFQSGSHGIISATATSNEDVFAIADSQNVLLHDKERGMRQSYRLKRGEVSDDAERLDSVAHQHTRVL